MLKIYVAISIIMMVLVSCRAGNGAQNMMDNYLYRLANSLEQKTPKSAVVTPLLSYPSRRQLLVDIPPVKVSILDFLRLSQCDIQRLVGERNSSLGRVSKDSQRFLYDVKFIRLASQCIQWLSDNKQSLALKEMLIAALDHKERFLLSQWFNATLASEEFAMLFSLGSTPLTAGEITVPPSQLVKALSDLTTVYGNQFQGADKIEDDFAVIGSSAYMGQLRHSMALVSRVIDKANPLLDYRIHNKPLCLGQRPNRQSEIVHTVFLMFYIGEVQPYIAKLHQQAKVLMEHIDRLQKPHKSTEFSQFWAQVYSADNSEWQHFNRQVADHTHKWQALLSQCGLRPGQ